MLKSRYWTIGIVSLLLLAAALLRMGHLAGAGGATLREEALRIAEVHGEISAIRGRILDAAGNPLAWSVRRYDFAVKNGFAGNVDEVGSAVRTAFGENWGKLDELASGSVIKYDLTMNELEKADELCRQCPALEVNLAWERLYSESADLELLGKVAQTAGMEVGISGLEAEFEESLKGRPGIFSVMVDRNGVWIDATFRIEREPEAGEDLILEEEITEVAQ